MIILYVSNDLSAIGGIEKYNADFISSLRDLGEEVHVVERKSGGWIQKINFLCKLILAYIQVRPDVVHCSHLNFSILCLIMKYLLGINFSVALYGIEIPDLNGIIKRKVAKHAVCLVTISEFSRELILKSAPEVSDKIFMMPSSVNGSTFYPKPKNKTLMKKYALQGKPVILSLARLSTGEYKGQDRVLKALPKILKSVPDAIYLIAGGGSDNRIHEFLISNPELAKSVIFTGAVSADSRVDHYNLADVYILPSKFEGFGIVFIEALACGLPVIASDAFGCRAGLLNGELGLLVNPDDIDMIADAVVSVLDGSAPEQIYDKDRLRGKTLEVYGLGQWRERVSKFVENTSESLGFSDD